MAKSDSIIVLWEVIECVWNASFKVKVLKWPIEWIDILCNISWKMRMYYIKILLWDLVKVEISPYSLDKWRISTRFRWWNDSKLKEDLELKEFLEEKNI